MTIKEFAVKHGARKTAKKLVDNRVKMLAGLGLDELPDTFEISEIVDQLEEIIKTDPDNRESVKEVLSNIDHEFIEALIFS